MPFFFFPPVLYLCLFPYFFFCNCFIPVLQPRVTVTLSKEKRRGGGEGMRETPGPTLRKEQEQEQEQEQRKGSPGLEAQNHAKRKKRKNEEKKKGEQKHVPTEAETVARDGSLLRRHLREAHRTPRPPPPRWRPRWRGRPRTPTISTAPLTSSTIDRRRRSLWPGISSSTSRRGWQNS